MPQYEYQCQSCKKKFTVTLSMAEYEEKARQRQIKCPKCSSTEVKHLIESVYVTTSRKS
ncbi:MAG: zinc ribbon domain-containing protein [Opitutaceae bacterium]|nr:zinc ribbon domain-containing protein [Opitutaceae bacterium]